jgi:formiminoglutamase
MDKLLLFKESQLSKITNHRSGEVKFGEQMYTVPKNTTDVLTYIKECEAQFVLLGIPEDVGVRANNGKPGSDSAWECAIKSIANIQHNRFCKGYHLLVLGTLDVSVEMEEIQNLDFTVTNDRIRMSELVVQIDKDVTHIINMIIKTGKTPVIIGGGHNNAYGNIKGTALAMGKPINAINFDAHSDFRILEGRHSGNGFSYAFEEGFLNKYFIFGLHESYTSKSVLKKLRDLNERVLYTTYEEINIRREKNFEQQLELAHNFIKDTYYGIEIDLDAIPFIASSAMTPSGFSIEELRRFIYYFSKHKNAAYIHICEGAPSLDNDKTNHLVGKLIGYLITDFMKGKRDAIEVIL